MKHKIALLAILNLITFGSHCDFLDLAGVILWQADNEGFCSQFEICSSRKFFAMDESFEVDRRLASDRSDFASYKSWTLLMMAAHKGLYDAVVVLLKAGANIRLKNEEGKTARDLAKEAGFENIATLLLEPVKSLVEQAMQVIVSEIAKEQGKLASNDINSLPSDLVESIKNLSSQK